MPRSKKNKSAATASDLPPQKTQLATVAFSPFLKLQTAIVGFLEHQQPIMLGDLGTAFDPYVARPRVSYAVMSLFLIGAIVQLANGQLALVSSDEAVAERVWRNS